MEDSDDGTQKRNQEVLRRKLQNKKKKKMNPKSYDKSRKSNNEDNEPSPRKNVYSELGMGKKSSEYRYSTFKNPVEKKMNSTVNNITLLEEIDNQENVRTQLLYGSYIVINIEIEQDIISRKITTNYRISPKPYAVKMEDDDFDANWVFRIIPAARHEMMEQIKHIIDENEIPDNVEVDFENFISEMQANVDVQNKLMGKPVKYGSRFQLVQQSSKRFLSIRPAETDIVLQTFKNGYTDTQCFELWFSEYPTTFTHFMFEEWSLFQTEGEAIVKDNHFMYLCALFDSDMLYLYNEKYLFMTQSYKSPISYNRIKESNTFDELKNVSSNEVVLLTYSNDSYYLNVPQVLDQTTGALKEQNILFQNWEDSKDIDFNGWFMIEYDDETHKVYLKHFNTGKYVTIINGSGINDEATLQVEKSQYSEVIFEPVNSDESNVENYTSEVVFKIRPSSTRLDDKENYLRIADEDDISQIRGDETRPHEAIGLKTEDTIPLVVKAASSINKHDTFNFVFPTNDKYRELIFVKDMRSYLNKYLATLRNSNDLLEAISQTVGAIHDVFHRILCFLTNQLEGRISADFDIGQIMPYRQEMISKVGISICIYEFLHLLTQIRTEEGEEDWSNVVSQMFLTNNKIDIKYDNTLDLIFETIDWIVFKNSTNQLQASIYIKVLQKFLFVEKISSVIISIFKDREFESNEKEVHREILYKRIYEYDRLGPLVKSFIKMLKKHRERKYLYILTRLWVIDGNPLPLIQNEIFELLFESENLDTIYEITYPDKNSSWIYFRHNLNEVLASNIQHTLEEEEVRYIIDQLGLESNLCHGRNGYLQFFKQRYPVDMLVKNILNEQIPKSIRAMLIKILTNLYVDDHPYTLIKMARSFKAYKCNEDLEDNNAKQTNEFDEYLLEEILSYYQSYFSAFASQVFGSSSVKEFEIEMIRSCKFMLKLGLLTDNSGNYMVEFIHSLFGFLWFILDIFTNRKDFIILQSLDSIAQKDSVIDNYMQNNPIQKSTFDIKYSLLNKKDWLNSLSSQLNKGVSNQYSSTSFRYTILLEIIEIFHFLMDLRQNYLMMNIVQLFSENVCEKYEGIRLNEQEEMRK